MVNNFCRESILSILNSQRWKDAMRTATPNKKISHSIIDSITKSKSVLETPMRQLIERYPDLAQVVLDKCYKEKKDDQDISVEMNFEFIEDTYNYQKKSENNFTIKLPFEVLDADYLHFTEQSKQHILEDGFEDPYTPDFQLVKRNHPLMIMADYSRHDLLRHPLCLSLVRYKWHKYGKFPYYFNLLSYFTFLMFLTAFVLTSPSPIQNPEYYDCSQYFKQNVSMRPIINGTFEYKARFEKSHNSCKWMMVLMIVIYVLRIFNEGTIMVFLKVIMLR